MLSSIYKKLGHDILLAINCPSISIPHGNYVIDLRLSRTLADLVVFPIAATADSFGLDLERFPEVTGWYNRLMSEYPMRKAMAGLDLA